MKSIVSTSDFVTDEAFVSPVGSWGRLTRRQKAARAARIPLCESKESRDLPRERDS